MASRKTLHPTPTVGYGKATDVIPAAQPSPSPPLFLSATDAARFRARCAALAAGSVEEEMVSTPHSVMEKWLPGKAIILYDK